MQNVAPKEEDHWAYTLFVKQPELYLPVLESGKETAIAQTDGLCKILNGLGISQGAKILDLACGIGRYSIPLARRGYEVVGYDLSPQYIDYAKKWAKVGEGLKENTLRFYQGDIRDVTEVLSIAGETGFNAIISMETSHGYFGEEEDNRMFKELLKIAAHNSVFIIEAVSRDGLVRKFKPHSINSISDIVEQRQIREFNLETSEMENDWRFYEKMSNGDLKLLLTLAVIHRIYTLYELKNVLENAGWKYHSSYGSVRTLEPVIIDSFYMVIVSQKS
jgi:cyclopropane fatty-acyl-phospholipid synthase-like methyltransferase